MTKRSLRHFKTRVKAIPFAFLVLLFAYTGMSILRSVGHGFAGAVLAGAAGSAFLVLAALIIREVGKYHARWLREQDAEDAIRCVLPSCDAVLRRPFVKSAELGGAACGECYRRIMRAEPDLPTMTRKAGA